MKKAVAADKAAGRPQRTSAAVNAVQAWRRVGRKGRSALLAMDIHTVYSLEEHVLDFLDSVRFRSLACVCSWVTPTSVPAQQHASGSQTTVRQP
jgi:hypothetical protein